MEASPIWVDRPAEREEVAGDAVDDGLGLGLDELDTRNSGASNLRRATTKSGSRSIRAL